jgi:TonB family protein
MKKLLPLALGLAVIGWPASAPAQSGEPGRGGRSVSRRCDAPEPTEQEADEKIYAPAELTCRAVIKSRPSPNYTRSARQKGVRGTVALRVVPLASGKVGEVEIVRGLPEGLSEAAVEAAKQIRFRPAIKGDRWVSQRISFEHRFNLY